MNQETIYIIIPIILILATCLIIKNRLFKQVENISENVKQLKYLNSMYDFKILFSKKRRINHKTNSYRSYNKVTFIDVVGYHIENDIDNIRTDIESAIINKEKYQKYLNEFKNLNYKTNMNEIKINNKFFNKIEKKILKKQMIKNVYNITVKIIIYYESPKGRNFYKKDSKLVYEQLVEQYNNWNKKKSYQISAKYERSIMSDSIRYDVLKRDNYKCCICGLSASNGATLHVDHIIPVSKGGKTVMDNLQTLCERCNLGKSNKE